jgi:hypothetical protein
VDNLIVNFEDGTVLELRKPSKMVIELMMVNGRRNPLDMARVLIKNCLVKGDAKKLQGLKYENQLLRQLDELLGKVACEVEWDEAGENGTVTFVDGKSCDVTEIGRNEYSNCLQRTRTKPLGAIEKLIKQILVPGDFDPTIEVGYLLGIADILDDLLQTVPSRLGE